MTQENVDLSLLTATGHGAFASAGSIYPPAGTIVTHKQQQPAETIPEGTTTNNNNYVAATELLFNEIKTFCNDFEAASYQHLTPPQSPPPPPPTSPLFVANQYQQQYNIPQQQQPNICYVADAPSMTSSSSSVANALNHFQCQERSFVDLQLQSNECLEKTFVLNDEPSPVAIPQPTTIASAAAPVDSDLLALELIDELLRNKTKDVHENYILVNTGHVEGVQQQQSVASRLNGSNEAAVQAITSMQFGVDMEELDYCDDSATQFSTPSYGNSLASSPSRSGSPLDLEDSQEDDDEWMPKGDSNGKMRKQKRGDQSSLSTSLSPSKRRPYERGGGELEKKSRKKEQNKNAATRYRQKKKQEVETILEQETRLKKTNKKLVTQFGEARRELKYLKNLLRDMYKQNDIVI